MNEPAAARPRPYYPKMPATWWLRNRRYFLFILRELTSVFIAIFLVVFLIEIAQLTRGPEEYAAFLRRLESPGWIAFHVLALLFALYHSLTWFALTSRVQVVRVGGRQVPPPLLNAGIIGGWLVLSVAILLLFLFAKR
jgi:fumarate reductase subunit C